MKKTTIDKSQFAAADKEKSEKLFTVILPATLASNKTFGFMKEAERALEEAEWRKENAAKTLERLRGENKTAEELVMTAAREFVKHRWDVQNLLVEKMQGLVAGCIMPVKVMLSFNFCLGKIKDESKGEAKFPLIGGKSRTAEAFANVFGPIKSMSDISKKIEMKPEKDAYGMRVMVPEVTIENGKILLSVAEKAGNTVPKFAIDALEKRLIDWEARTTGKSKTSGNSIKDNGKVVVVKLNPPVATKSSKEKGKAMAGKASKSSAKKKVANG